MHGVISISDNRRALAAAALLCAFATAALPAAAPAKKRSAPRADLSFSSASVSRPGTKISGSFAVKNAGKARAGASTAALIARGKKKSYTLSSFAVPSLKPGRKQSLKVSVKVSSKIPAGTYKLELCLDRKRVIKESSESNNCRTVGKLKVPASATPTPTPTPTPSPETRPTAPIPFEANTALTLSSSAGPYFAKVPPSYAATHDNATTLFVWMHGCGGEAAGDLDTISPGGDRSYIAISLGGRDGGCWDVNSDPALVLAAIADMKTHFNINPRRVILGGYSSGGDLAYRTAFYNAGLIAGVLAENTAPFRDTGSTAQQSLAAAVWKFNVVHVAHTEDDTYDIATVRSEIQTLKSNGYPATLIERPGSHYDDSTATTGTDHDLQTLLLPHIDDGWLAPA
jgi:CARDB